MEKLKNNTLKRFGFFCFILWVSVSCYQRDYEIELVSQAEMEDLILADSIQLIDVRSFEEFQNKHIKGAQSIVFDEDFEENIQKLDKTKPVAVYCNTGRRSEECSDFLREKGFTKIYDLKGGITKWEYNDFIIENTNTTN
jgi:rhodanese-related sulfurtransferase